MFSLEIAVGTMPNTKILYPYTVGSFYGYSNIMYINIYYYINTYSLSFFLPHIYTIFFYFWQSAVAFFEQQHCKSFVCNKLALECFRVFDGHFAASRT